MLRLWPECIKYPYMRIYDALVTRAVGPAPAPVRLLLLGGGGYVFPNYLYRTRPGSEIVVVEIDPGVTRAAIEAFGFPADAPVEIHHMDARNYVADAVRRNADAPGSVPPFDLVVCDSVSDYSVPFQLTTREFIADVKTLLKPGGLYVMNLIDAYRPGAFMNAVAQTFASVFPWRGAVSVTTDPVIVYTSNIFAIMGLRSLFFLLSDIADRFWLLHFGLGALLCFIGVKMIGGEFFHWHIDTLVSLLVILGILVVSILLSMLIKKRV